VSQVERRRANVGAVGVGGSTPIRTGNWTVIQPEIDPAQCNGCLLCWVFCPDGCIHRSVVEGVEQALVIDYAYCKGCGICARECPRNAVAMVGR
jgi:2-oxoacid:acceptor oxidoreductase delta subunit (pyruvate/2-ketoisovalerate family)